MEGRQLIPRHSPAQYAEYAPVYASDNSFVLLGNIYGQDALQVEYESFCRSLHFPELSLREESMKSAYDGTFEWVFQQEPAQSRSSTANSGRRDQRYVAADKFRSWLSNDSSDRRFWVRGKAGSGKSTFMNFVGCHGSFDASLRLWNPSRDYMTLKYYFWHLGSPMQRNIIGCWKSILWQFFSVKPDLGFRIWCEDLRSLRIVIWSSRNLHIVLRSVLQKSNCSFCFLIDGVDECVDSSDLIDVLHDLENEENLKICVSSRPERRYELAFTNWPHLQLDQLTFTDMRVYATKRLQDLFLRSALSVAADLHFHELVQILLRKAEGVFVWLCVAVQSLREGFENLDDSSALLRRIDEFPEDVHQLYLYILERHRSNLKRYAANAALVFKLLLRSSSQLPHRSIRQYLMYGQDKELTSVCLSRITWARDKALRERFFQSDMNFASIEACWSELRLEPAKTHLPVHCGNFVEVVERPLHILQRKNKSKFEARQPGLTPMIFNHQYVQFIHKTVGDFLTDQETGKILLEKDPSTDEQLDMALWEADLIIAVSYMILTGETKDKVSRVLMAGLGHAEEHYIEWRLTENVLSKAFNDASEHQCCRCLLEEHNGALLCPNRHDGFLYFCVALGRLDYLRLAIKDQERSILPSTLTDLLLMTSAICLYWDNPPADFVHLDYVMLFLGELVAYGADPNPSPSSLDLPTNNRFPSVPLPSLHDLLNSEQGRHDAKARLSQLFGNGMPREFSSPTSPSADATNTVGPARSRMESYKLAVLHWLKRDASEEKDSFQIAGKIATFLEEWTHYGFAQDICMRLVLWHEEQGFWYLLSPTVSRLLLASHASLHHELMLGTDPLNVQSIKLRSLVTAATEHVEHSRKRRLVFPGLTWFRLAEDLTDFDLGLRCVFRHALRLPSLDHLLRHLHWPDKIIDQLLKHSIGTDGRPSQRQLIASVCQDLSIPMMCTENRDANFGWLPRKYEIWDLFNMYDDVGHRYLEKLEGVSKALCTVPGSYVLPMSSAHPEGVEACQPEVYVPRDPPAYECENCTTLSIVCFGMESSTDRCVTCRLARRGCIRIGTD